MKDNFLVIILSADQKIRVPVGKVNIFMLVLLWKIVVSLKFPSMKGNLHEEMSG